MHRISVVIPTYDRPDGLSKLLDSLLEQVIKPSEVIIVDDTPTAVIELVCKKYEESFRKVGVELFYVRNLRERSISIARNLGAKIAKGDVIQFFDSDVILQPDYLQEIEKAFEEHPEALGIDGWPVWSSLTLTGVKYVAVQTLKKLFFLYHYTRNSVKHFEFPVVLNTEIRSQWLSGGWVAFKSGVFSKFQFDENLKEYSFMENVLFSGLIDKAYPGRLIKIPYAKCYHENSPLGRMEKSELRLHKLRCRKYVLTKLFGTRGLLIFGWQNLGMLTFRLISRIRKVDYLIVEE
jgi:glycosyltransferase involved in cell wall biosynthesis